MSDELTPEALENQQTTLKEIIKTAMHAIDQYEQHEVRNTLGSASASFGISKGSLEKIRELASVGPLFKYDDQEFTCPKCGGHYFGTYKEERSCHDQHGKGCRWKGKSEECGLKDG